MASNNKNFRDNLAKFRQERDKKKLSQSYEHKCEFKKMPTFVRRASVVELDDEKRLMLKLQEEIKRTKFTNIKV